MLHIGVRPHIRPRFVTLDKNGHTFFLLHVSKVMLSKLPPRSDILEDLATFI
jgi:hypothetical protein